MCLVRSWFSLLSMGDPFEGSPIEIPPALPEDYYWADTKETLRLEYLVVNFSIDHSCRLIEDQITDIVFLIRPNSVFSE